MILQRVEQADWLSNAYLVVDEPGGNGVLVDSNGVTDPLAERAEREGTEITHVLLTHHHWDHVVGRQRAGRALRRPDPRPRDDRRAARRVKVDETFADGDVIETGGLRIEVIHTPGHCADHLRAADRRHRRASPPTCSSRAPSAARARPGATGFADLRALDHGAS